MKKGQVYEGIVEKVVFPNKGIITIEDKRVIVKNAVEGQRVKFSVNKIRKGRGEGRIIEVLQKAPFELAKSGCEHFGSCGGCTYQNIPYEEQLKLKQRQVKELLDSVIDYSYRFEGIKKSPKQFEYRNKMEFSFGDEIKDGPLALGMHKRGSFHDIVTVNRCRIVDNDYNLILECVLNFFTDKNVNFYHKLQHKGYLRHLLVRKAAKTKEILVDLVTTTQDRIDLTELVDELNSLPLDGEIVGILNTLNDSLADVVQSDETIVLYGRDYIYENLLGLRFKISPFSFFQTNSLGAEVLYETAREYAAQSDTKDSSPQNTLSTGEAPEYVKDKLIFDLYSGTGTIAQMFAPVAKRVIGVEIVEEAVEAAKVNAKLNGLSNCEFIAGDVLKVIDTIKEKPDLIVLDPPRDGIHPKALKKIIDFGVDRIVYISCKPTSLVRDLEVLQENGYKVERGGCVDLFPGTVHVETVVGLQRKDN